MNHVVVFCSKRSNTFVNNVANLHPVKTLVTVNELRSVLSDTGKKLKLSRWTDWYQVPTKNYKDLFGSQFTEEFKSSPVQLLSTAFPEHDWLPWKFERCPPHYWKDPKNQRKFLDWAGKELGIKDMSDWYKVTQREFISIGGAPLLFEYYHSSISLLLSSVYTEYEWLPWKFNSLPRNYWDNVNNQIKFVNWAGKELGIKEMSDWYNITSKKLCELGGQMLMTHTHKNSIVNLLCTVYPHYDWLPWQFVNTPKNFWRDDVNKRKFIEWAGKQLGVKVLDDWNKVSEKDVKSLSGNVLLSKYSLSLSQLLSTVYPNRNWTTYNDKQTLYSRKSQHLLKLLVKTIFPTSDVLEDYKHPDLLTSNGLPLELDLFYPQLNLALEYQGVQHFRNVEVFNSDVGENKVRDKLKSELCKEKGITLIEVPYWWDRTIQSLAATIYAQRPDLFSEEPWGQPIPMAPTDSVSRAPKKSATLMLATEWDSSSMDPTGWILTEKYDGMRLYWNGSEFYSRQGKQVKVPDSIKITMPKIALDGELWTQYGLHQDAVTLPLNKDEEKWKKAVFWVFDITDMSVNPFEERLNRLKELKEQGMLPSFVKVVDTVKCTGKQHLQEFFEHIVAKGGEGVVLRDPQSLYKPGRSSSMRKFKPYFDTEVKVVTTNYPHGFDCVQLNGKELFVGLSDNLEEAKKVTVGSVITVKHQGMNVHGTLQYPKFFRERNDVKWEDLINT